MKYQIVYFLLFTTSIFAQNQLNTKLVSQLSYTEELNDIWGYVALDGTEYALVGTRNGTSIVSLVDPANPVEVSKVNGSRSVWRDIKTHNEYAYVVADQGEDGLLIIDMSSLPDSTGHVFWKEEVSINGIGTRLRTCHNLYIDNGFLYLSGCNIGNRGVLIFDINEDPLNPKYVGAANLNYSHDVFVRDNLLFASEINNGLLGIYDISDKANPILKATQLTSSSFTHNAWSSEDNKYVFTTDERPNAFLDVYDISDLDQIQKVEEYQVLATQGAGVIPHNTHHHNDFLITSWYTEGVVILDASRPKNLIRVGQYDTWDGPHGNFNGCWGAYPFLPSGLVLASDISNGLFVIDVDYNRASFLEGKVLDKETGQPINGAKIRFSEFEENVQSSDPNGNFTIGLLHSGRVKVFATHPEYVTDTLAIQFDDGLVVYEDFVLERLKTVDLSIEVIDRETGLLIDDADFIISSGDVDKEGSTNGFGQSNLEVIGGNSKIICGKLGYKTQEFEFIADESDPTLQIQLDKGIEDDFTFSYGWAIKTTATTGSWQRVVPQGTFFTDLKSNPDTDSPDDIGNKAFITGVNALDVAERDVDGGKTTLISPLFDISDIEDPEIEYSLWFFNGGGAGSVPNDYLEVAITNSHDTVIVETITDPNSLSGRWRDKSHINVDEFIGNSNSIQIMVTAEDASPGHLVEAGFDDFAIVSATTTPTEEEISDAGIVIRPNAFSDVLKISSAKKMNSVTLFDISGKRIISYNNINSRRLELNTTSIIPAIYIAEIIMKEGQRISYKLIKSKN